MYVTTAVLKSFAQTPESHPDEVFDLLAASASLAFDNAVGVADGFFNAAGDSATENVIRADGRLMQLLPPFVPGSLTTIVPEDGFDLPSDYRISDAEVGRQYLIINVTTVPDPFLAGMSQGYPTSYQSNLQQYPVIGWTNTPFDLTITAKWGFETIPADVQQAVIEYSLMTWRNRTDPSFARISDVGTIDRKTPLFDSVVTKYKAKFDRKVLF